MFKEKGVTLFETLVVIGIVIIFSVIAVFDFSEARGQMALKRAAHQLIQDLRRAEEMAMSSVQSEKCSLPAKGYGIYVRIEEDTKSYKLYADTAGDEQFPSEWEYYTPADCLVETINIQEKGVIIKEANVPNQKVSINFKPPNPDIKIKWLQGNEIEIVLALESDLSKTKTVIASKAGVFQIR